MQQQVEGQIVDLHKRSIYPGRIIIEGKKIKEIVHLSEAPHQFILPGFIDAHIHIESSMVLPTEFANIALKHGTLATVSDPHEIANVMGVEGVQYMINNAKRSPLKFHFGAPSCVPATSFETSGSVINSASTKELLKLDDIHYLAEMMNYPGVLYEDEEVMKKIAYAKEVGKPIDGHAPGLRGKDAQKYIEAGITTDHECFTLEEALDKLKHGTKILIREGSAAKNFEALHPLFNTHPGMLMFCSDDKHPDDLMVGHINQLVVRAIKLGYNLFDVLSAACIQPAQHYKMKLGLLREGDLADFIIVKNLEQFSVLYAMIEGEWIVHDSILKRVEHSEELINNFHTSKKEVTDFTLPYASPFPLIKALDGQLVTEKEMIVPKSEHGNILADVDHDHLKICVVNRYNDSKPACGLIKNFMIKEGAIASTVAHDSHNIVAVGTSDVFIKEAVNLLIQSKGGLSAVNAKVKKHLPLPIAGLMSPNSCEQIAQEYAAIDQFVKGLGCALKAPFMTLSFMALLVIPKIKMSDLGVFDAEKFEWLIKA